MDVHVSAAAPAVRLESRIKSLVRRYLLAELVATGATFATVAVCVMAGVGLGPALVASSWSESVAFYGFMVARERATVSDGRSPTLTAVRRLACEFGPAEAADMFVVRPLLLLAGARTLGTVPGLIAGKIAADILFYVVASPVQLLRLRSR